MGVSVWWCGHSQSRADARWKGVSAHRQAVGRPLLRDSSGRRPWVWLERRMQGNYRGCACAADTRLRFENRDADGADNASQGVMSPPRWISY